MTPDELIEAVGKLGISISRATLLRYEKEELLPLPMRGAEGRGYGRYTDYPETAPFELFASIMLMKRDKVSPELIAAARKLALQYEAGELILSRRDNKSGEKLPYGENNGILSDEERAKHRDIIGRFEFRHPYARTWLQYKTIAKRKIHPALWDAFPATVKTGMLLNYHSKVVRGLEAIKSKGTEFEISITIWIELYRKYPDLRELIRDIILEECKSDVEQEAIDILIKDALG